MDFYSYVEKIEFENIIEQAKRNCVKEALDRLKSFDAMNENFFKAAMPDTTPNTLIKKRTNKLARMKHKKDFKRLFG